MNREYIYFNEDSYYYLPMVKTGEELTTYIWNCPQNIKCKLKNYPKEYSIRLYAEGYNTVTFVDKYFEFLLYTGYVKERHE